MKNTVERLWPQANDDPQSDNLLPPSARSVSQQSEDVTSLEELRQSLAKAERRINRLIGERSQLSTLLDKRDKKIDELNLELGRLRSHHEAGPPRPHMTRDVLWRTRRLVSALSTRIATLLKVQPNLPSESGPNDVAIGSGELFRTPIGARIGDGTDRQVVGVMLLGLEKDAIAQLLPSIERECMSTGLRPLLVVDIDDFEVFRAHGLPFEFLPSSHQRECFDRSLNWDLYLQRRLAIIRRKWDPIKLVAFGAFATKTLELWSASPFEEIPLPGTSNRS